MPALDPAAVKTGFQKASLEVFNERQELEEWLKARNYNDAIMVFMSSGNYDGLDTEAFAKRIIQPVA